MSGPRLMRLLVFELWRLGDLAVAAPFLRLASQNYEVTLVAKPLAQELRPRFWPEVRVVPFVAPWTVFRGKYRLHKWPWKMITHLLETVRRENFDAAVSARWDPRDHLLMALTGAKRRYGFPRWGSQVLLTDPMNSRERLIHRYSYWQELAKALGFDLPAHNVLTHEREGVQIVVHTGASQPVKVWPLERYARLVRRLRHQGYMIQVLCDINQLQFWRDRQEAAVAPRSLTELCRLLDSAEIFIGNDSGPGHLAAVSGIPTFTIFGNQSPALFAPIHPASEWIEGAPCRYKPCYDSCRFSVPHCLVDIDEETVCREIEMFATKQLSIQRKF
jgi:ADP-heptose:LPS heptosyltransferase